MQPDSEVAGNVLKTDFTFGGTFSKATTDVNDNSDEVESDVELQLSDADLKEKAFKNVKENLLQLHAKKCSESVSAAYIAIEVVELLLISNNGCIQIEQLRSCMYIQPTK